MATASFYGHGPSSEESCTPPDAQHADHCCRQHPDTRKQQPHLPMWQPKMAWNWQQCILCIAQPAYGLAADSQPAVHVGRCTLATAVMTRWHLAEALPRDPHTDHAICAAAHVFDQTLETAVMTTAPAGTSQMSACRHSVPQMQLNSTVVGRHDGRDVVLATCCPVRCLEIHAGTMHGRNVPSRTAYGGRSACGKHSHAHR